MPDDRDPVTTPRWLDAQEMETWLRVLRLVMLLPGTLDRQLRRDSGLMHSSYMILATLSDAPDTSMQMTDLARATATSASRLSHAVAALEQRGWVTRHRAPEDRRRQIATLTDGGKQILVQTAPGHVEQVRTTVLDPLEPHEVQQLSALLAKIVGPLEADATETDPTHPAPPP